MKTAKHRLIILHGESIGKPDIDGAPLNAQKMKDALDSCGDPNFIVLMILPRPCYASRCKANEADDWKIIEQLVNQDLITLTAAGEDSRRSIIKYGLLHKSIIISNADFSDLDESAKNGKLGTKEQRPAIQQIIGEIKKFEIVDREFKILGI